MYFPSGKMLSCPQCVLLSACPLVCCGRIFLRYKIRPWSSHSAAILSLMSHSYARWALLLLISSTTFVQTLAIEIPYNDPRVTYTPKFDDGTWCVVNQFFLYLRKSHRDSRTTTSGTSNTTEPCPGAWSTFAGDGKHTISLNFRGYVFDFFFVKF